MERDNTNDVYKECQRNHAASLGSYATDGCGEFAALDLDHHMPKLCAACGCHRNFHRKITTNPEILELYNNNNINGIIQVPESPESSVQISYNNKKRCRTKFTEEQKEKMQDFAEKLGWKLQRRNGDDDQVEMFCKDVGVSRKVFKVWMHNHKPFTTTSNENVASSRAQDH